MRALVVGAKGMLGTELVREFSLHGEVFGLDLPSLDITDADQCRRAVRELLPEVIVNAAAMTDVDYCEEHRQEAFRINGEGAGNLAQAAAPDRLLIHYSTDYVFDGRKPAAYTEEDTPNPISVYGQSKLRGEELVRTGCANHLILRTAWLFGPAGRNFIRTIVTAARGGQKLRVVEDQRGSPTYARDLARCTWQLLQAGGRGIYHTTNSGACTWYELAVRSLEWARITDVSVAPVSTAEFPRPAPRPANSTLANNRLARAGLPPMRPWAEAVEEYVVEYLS
jgi:dTDP-4-dehydrorhamnose reductase